MKNDPMREFFRALFQDGLEQKIIEAAIDGKKPSELLDELLSAQEGVE